ncbi:MAG: hypothetical protein K2W78_13800 [Xanthobacteraceae bacterium]|nr:hypothetical protein [Xanthobacteraceae bacterium]
MTKALDRSLAVQLLGEAALQIWGNLPHDVQEKVFEQSVRGSPDCRTGLAVFLHDIHPRTCERRSLA